MKKFVIVVGCIMITSMVACSTNDVVAEQGGTEIEVVSENIDDVTGMVSGVEDEVRTEGSLSSEEVPLSDIVENSEFSGVEDMGESEVLEDSPITFMDTVLYAQRSVNVRSGPGTEYDKLGTLSTNQEVTVTGRDVESGWYQIEYGETVAFVSDSYLGENKVVVTAPSDANVVNSGGAPAADNAQTTESVAQNVGSQPSDSATGTSSGSSGNSPGNGWFNSDDMQNALQFGEQFGMY